MSKKPLTISLVIPVYNEERHLQNCLEAVRRQRQPFHEIIVVDNNSSDATAAIIRQFPEIKLLHEAKQGVVHARTTGFNAATGEIIARIDGDTIVPPDWSSTLQTIFADNTVAAVSGKVEYYDMAADRLFNRIDLFFRRYFARVLGREVALQASNMAIRRSSWHKVRQSICLSGDLHEDFDLAIHTNKAGQTVRFDERLVAGIAYRQADASFLAFCTYAWLSPKTYRMHNLKSGRYMYPVVALAITCYLLLKLLHRGYDPEIREFSWARLLTADSAMRVNPATFVD